LNLGRIAAIICTPEFAIPDRPRSSRSIVKQALVAFCAFFLSVSLASPADGWNKKPIITFKEAVELPGFTLSPGTYVFRLLDFRTNRNIVQVMNVAESHNYGFILAIANRNLRPSGDSTLRFAERPSGSQPALRACCYSGDTWGHELVHPKAKATELAASARVPVLQAAVTPAEKPEALVQEPVVAITPKNTEVDVAIMVEAPPDQVAETEPVSIQQEPVELPHTGSISGSLILISMASGLLGGLMRRSKAY
jgi:hypothetical protein